MPGPDPTHRSRMALQEDHLEEQFSTIGRRLQRDLQSVLDAIPEESKGGPQRLARALGMPIVFVSQVLKALRTEDPVGVPYFLPGPDPLRRLLKAAKKQRIDGKLYDRAMKTVAEFESLIRLEVGDQSALETMTAAWLPTVREQFELRRKQAVYRGMSQLQGHSVETLFQTAILHPGADGKLVDLVFLRGLVGWRQLRAGAQLKLACFRFKGRKHTLQDLEGNAAETLTDLRLDRFCENPAPSAVSKRVGHKMHYSIHKAAYGLRSEHDLITGQLQPGDVPLWKPMDDFPPYSLFALVKVPAKSMQFDVLVHRSVFRGVVPKLHVYQTTFGETVDPEDPSNVTQELDVLERLIPLGTGTRAITSESLSRYHDVVLHALDVRGWDPEEFQVYRCSVQYPILGTGVAVRFQPIVD